MSAREPQLIVGTGQKGIGKTYLTDKFIISYLFGGIDDPFNPMLTDANVALFLSKNPHRSRFQLGRSVLIFDSNSEGYWKKYDTLYYDCDDPDEYSRTKSIRDFGKASSQGWILCRRIAAVTTSGRRMSQDQMRQTVMDIINAARNCLLLLDDTNSYFNQNDYTNSPLAQKITTNRHSNLDVLVHMQGVRMSPMMYQNVGFIRMHKQTEPVDRYKATMPNFDVVKIGQIIIDKRYQAGNIRTYIYIDLSGRKLFGKNEHKITYQEFKAASRQFLIGNPSYLKPSLSDVKTTNPSLSKHELTKSAINLWIKHNARIAFD